MNKHSHILAILVLSLIAPILASCGETTPAPLPTNGAAAFRWGAYMDTDLDLANFYPSDHTIMLHFMAQYERAYEGPLLANTGTDTYLVEMGDYAAAGNKVNLFVNIKGATARYLIPNPAKYPADVPDYINTTSAPPPPVLPWRHLALVKQGNSLSLWLNAQRLLPEGSTTDLILPAGTLTGRLQLGKRIIGTNERETQFYGFIDNVAVFNYAMGYSDIVQLAGQTTLTGAEQGMTFGAIFQQLPAAPGGLWGLPFTLQGSSYLQEISGTQNAIDDTSRLPIPTMYQTYHLPLKRGEVWQVLQAFNSYGSHGSYAAFFGISSLYQQLRRQDNLKLMPRRVRVGFSLRRQETARWLRSP
jgi:hypothetical protein